MAKKNNKSNKQTKEKDFPGYPIYSANEDIYSKAKEETDLDPENPKRKKAPNESPGMPNEINNMKDMSGGDLCIPGSELDYQQESIGSEDEENNFYSIGGEDKESLEEDKTQ